MEPTLQSPPVVPTPDVVPTQPAPKKSQKWLILGIAGVVLVAIIAVVVFLLTRPPEVKITTPTAENHLAALVRVRGSDKAITALYSNTIYNMSSHFAAMGEQGSAANRDTSLTLALGQLKVYEAMVKKLDETKNTINGDAQSYKELEPFLATAKGQLAFMQTMVGDLDSGKDFLPNISKYGHLYGNPLNPFDLLSKTQAEAKATAITAKKELETLIAQLEAYRPSNDIFKRVKTEYTENFKKQLTFATALIEANGEMSPPINLGPNATGPKVNVSDVAEVNQKAINESITATYDGFKKDFKAKKDAVDVKLVEYLAAHLSVPATDLNARLTATVEAMKAELGEELYASFKRSLQ